MQTDKFIKLCLDRQKDLTRHRMTHHGSISWANYFALADLTRFVDYNCKFTELGCKRHRLSKRQKKRTLEILGRSTKPRNRIEIRRGEAFSWSIMCCCSGCASSVGHAASFPNNRTHLKRIARHYNDVTGFWRPEKGCVLPRKYRSPTCLKHSCGNIKPRKLAAALLNLLSLSGQQVREAHNERTGQDHYWFENIVNEIRREMKKELENESG